MLSFLMASLAMSSQQFLNVTTTPPSNWMEIGKPLPNQTLSFGLLLPQNNLNILENLINNRSNPNSKNYGKWLSKSEVDLIVGTNTKDYNIVIDWLRNTIPSYRCLHTADSLYCKTTITNVNTLFNTEMLIYQNIITKNIIFSGRKSGYSIPTDLSNIIEIVIGINDFPESIHKNIKTKFPRENDYYITPLSLSELYNIKSDYYSDLVGSQSVVEFQNDECFNLNDLNNFIKDNALDNITITKSHIIGECDLQTQNPDIEASLDIQYQVGVNTNTNQEYVSVPDWLYQFANILYNLPNPPLVNSMSYGWAERDQCDPEVFPVCYIGSDPEVYSKRTNIEFLKLSLRGVTLLASSGDAGAAGRTNEGCTDDSPLNPVFPTSSPYVLSVGGTIVMNPVKAIGTSPLCKENNCIGGGDELNCNFDRCGWTSGGGFSNFFNRPWWQVNTSKTYLASATQFPPQKYFNKLGRAYPDIALVSHNYLVNIVGSYMAVDGTSASSPAVSGMISTLNNLRLSQNKSSLGLVAPLLYDMYQKCPKCFKDIVEGSNNSTEATDCQYGYNAAKGFDAVYGLGLPNFDEMYKYVKNMKN
jgi:subtilase family serine protease